MPERDARSLSRHPFQVWALFAFVVGGFGALLGPAPGSVNELVPDWLRIIWGAVLLAGGITGLVSAWLPDRLVGLLVERIALSWIGGAAAAYGVAVLYVAGWGGLLAGTLVLSVAWAAVKRALDVTRTLRLLDKMLRGPA